MNTLYRSWMCLLFIMMLILSFTNNAYAAKTDISYDLVKAAMSQPEPPAASVTENSAASITTASNETPAAEQPVAVTPASKGKMIKGIYISQTTAEDTKYFSYLINRAKKVGITTFIVDLELPSKKYAQNMQLLKENGIHYVARIIMFPGGGTKEQVASIPYREKKLRLAKTAISYGASQIQLDYIRYNTKQIPSHKNSETIAGIIAWFKSNIDVPLQVDVFGISSFGESKYIGQSIQLIGKTVNVLCPMVYPSHYEPYKVHAVTPYETVYNSLKAIQNQYDNQPLPFKLIPYIELSNYRYQLSHAKKMAYIYAQIQAAENANADGWYVWSPRNMYDNLFYVLETKQVR
jgi:hypothetical protein